MHEEKKGCDNMDSQKIIRIASILQKIAWIVDIPMFYDLIFGGLRDIGIISAILALVFAISGLLISLYGEHRYKKEKVIV